MALLPDGPIDTLGVLDHVLAVPERLGDLELGPVEVPPATAVDHVVVCTGPAQASVGQLVAALAAPTATVPVLAHGGGPLPAHVGPRTLVIDVGAGTDPSVAPTASLPAAGDLARFDTLASTARVLAILEQLGHGADVAASVAAAATQLGRRRDELTGAGEPSRRLARRIGRTLPIVYGTGTVGAALAFHWKAQINRSAKVAAFANALPGLDRDEIAGWGQHGDMTRQVFSLLTLRHDHEDAGVRAAFATVEELVDEVVADRHEIRAEGEGIFAQVADLVLCGDVLSWHLAQELEIDPGPVAATPFS